MHWRRVSGSIHFGLVPQAPFLRGVSMSAAAVRILFVGSSTASAQSTLNELARSGWESHSVQTLQEADSVLRTIRFHLILATEKLADGTGYGLVSAGRAARRQSIHFCSALGDVLVAAGCRTGQQIAGRARAESGSVRDRSGKHLAGVRALHGSVARCTNLPASWRRIPVTRRPRNQARRASPPPHHAWNERGQSAAVTFDARGDKSRLGRRG